MSTITITSTFQCENTDSQSYITFLTRLEFGRTGGYVTIFSLGRGKWGSQCFKLLRLEHLLLSVTKQSLYSATKATRKSSDFPGNLFFEYVVFTCYSLPVLTTSHEESVSCAHYGICRDILKRLAQIKITSESQYKKILLTVRFRYC